MAFSGRLPASIPAAFAIAMLCIFAAIASRPAQAQTYTVLHSFTGFPDGKTPVAGVSMDAGGNLYGTTSAGGDDFCFFGSGCGTVYRLKHVSGGWVFEVLQIFTGANGLIPLGRVVFGPDGALYGTTESGGLAGRGTAFRLTPPPNPCHAVSCPWRETLLHQFAGGDDGDSPASEVLFDPAGNIYGTTQYGGPSQNCGPLGCGTVYKLTRSGNNWTYSVLYNFTSDENQDGAWPYAGVVRGQAGNLYGTTQAGGTGMYPVGVVFELTPAGDSWQETVLHYFTLDAGGDPLAGVVLDPAGNLFGATPTGGGMSCYGTIYELTPTNGGWDFTTPYCFPYHDGIGGGPQADLTLDSAGNLYGTTRYGGASHCGEVFKLTPQGGGWTRTILHEFQDSDGCEPMSNVLIDANGNLFGTTRRGGPRFNGVVWEITP